MMSQKMTLRLVIGDLGQRIEAVFGENDLAPGLHEKDLGAAPYGIAVVNDHNPDAAQLWINQSIPCPLAPDEALLAIVASYYGSIAVNQ
jgi:hypothetical protein